MAMLYALMAFWLTGGTLAQIIKSGPCPNVQVQQNFKMALTAGRWFEQAKFYSSYAPHSKCGIIDYTIGANNTMKLVNTLTSTITGQDEIFESEIIVPDYLQSAKTLGKIPACPIQGYNNLWVLGTDYNNWAVVFSCNTACSLHLEYAWILTRKQYPDKYAMRSAYDVVNKNNIDATNFVRMEHRGCYKHGSEY